MIELIYRVAAQLIYKMITYGLLTIISRLDNVGEYIEIFLTQGVSF